LAELQIGAIKFEMEIALAMQECRRVDFCISGMKKPPGGVRGGSIRVVVLSV
jgi:hypothetical protein